MLNIFYKISFIRSIHFSSFSFHISQFPFIPLWGLQSSLIHLYIFIYSLLQFLLSLSLSLSSALSAAFIFFPQ